jgi:WD40 repeat protein/serine/threonine protein kinase
MAWDEQRETDGGRTLQAVVESGAALAPVALAELFASDQAVRWRRGERVLAEAYLELSSALVADPEAACNLVYGEYLLREEEGETPSLEEYLDRFPRLEQGLRELHQAARLDDLLPWLGDVPPELTGGDGLAGDGTGRRADRASPLGLPGAGYRIVRTLAKGGLGEIFVAADQALNRVVALKEIQDRFARDPQIRSRFVQEAEITGALEHPGIVPVYTLGYYGNGRPYYVMRMIRGESLRETARRYHDVDAATLAPGERLLAFRRMLGRFQHVCDTVAYAHSRGVLHRDLKPENIMLGEFGETIVVDWGLAKRYDESGKGLARPPDLEVAPEPIGGDLLATKSGQVIGSPAYMSPEQAEGRHERLGPASDVYSLGATLYFLLTGRAPYERSEAGDVLHLVRRGAFPAPRQIQRSIDPALEAICLKAMAVRPEDRYPTPRALSNDIESWLADEPVSAHRDGWSRRLARWTRRYRAWAQTAGASLLMITVVSIAAAFAIRASWRQESLALNNSLRLSSRLAFDRALALFDRGQSSEGMLWLIRALKTAPPDADDLNRVIRANLANWRGSVLPLRHVLEHKDEVYTVAFSPDGRRLVSGSRDGTARLWDVNGGTPIGRPLAHGAEVCSVAWRPDGRVVLTGSHDGTARLWDAATGAPLGAPLAIGAKVRLVAFSPNGKLAATAAEDGTVRMWDAANGSPVGAPFKHPKRVWTLAFSPDGTILASGSLESTVRLWDVSQAAAIGGPLKHDGPVWALAFTPDGSVLASGSEDGSVRLWDPRKAQPIGEPLRHKNKVWALAFSPDGKRLATVSPDPNSLKDSTAQLWDMTTRKPLPFPLDHAGEAWTVAWNPGGTIVATGSDDNKARLWDAATGDLVAQAATHRGPVMAVAFSPDGNTLATGSRDFSVRLWDVSALRAARDLAHQGDVESVAFSFDGSLVLTGSIDHTGDFGTATPARR